MRHFRMFELYISEGIMSNSHWDQNLKLSLVGMIKWSDYSNLEYYGISKSTICSILRMRYHIDSYKDK